MPKFIVVVDDERTFVSNSEDTVLYLRNENSALAWFARWHATNTFSPEILSIDELWLDHDLGGDETTVVIVKFLVSLCFANLLPIEKIFVHSQNPVGAQNIVSYAQRICNDVVRTPLTKLHVSDT